MRLSEIRNFLRKESVFVIYTGQVLPAIVKGRTTFQDNDYGVTIAGGILHVKEDEIYRTEEEAARALFKQKLKGTDEDPAIHGSLQPQRTISEG